jgi:prepilin-type N-terminal cleavage/methylation domain-containing protein
LENVILPFFLKTFRANLANGQPLPSGGAGLRRRLDVSPGFSLVELMVVVGVIGILVMLARPKLMMFVAKAKISESKVMLNQISTRQESFFAEHSRYSRILSELGYSSVGKHYSVVSLEQTTDLSYWWVGWVGSPKSLCPGIKSDAWTTGNLMAGKYVQCVTFSDNSTECFTDCPTCNPGWGQWRSLDKVFTKCQ